MAESKKSNLTEYNWEEIKQHHSKQSLWIVIHNNVYDVTKFMEEHPGGEEVLMEISGKDATENFEDVGHSTDARELMKSYVIGKLDKESEAKCETEKKLLSSSNNFDSGESSSSWMTWVIPILAGLVAAVVYNYSR